MYRCEYSETLFKDFKKMLNKCRELAQQLKI